MEVRNMSDAKYLLLDSRIISRSEGVRCVLRTAEKDKHNPLFAEDKPWEPRFDNLYAEGGLDNCEPVNSNVTDGNIKWKDNRDLSRFINKPIRLQFELKSARLYAFGFSKTRDIIA
jgi:hypothetical protein